MACLFETSWSLSQCVCFVDITDELAVRSPRLAAYLKSASRPAFKLPYAPVKPILKSAEAEEPAP
jgi:hypothetical protein